LNQEKKWGDERMAEDLAGLIDKAKEFGALEARLIKASTIKTGAWVRMKCHFGCDGYNRSFCCPPHTPTPQETQQVIDCYETALLVHCKHDTRPTTVVVKLEREIFLSGYYKALGFGAGPCMLCKECNLKQCNYANRTRPSMEACGIDVYATVRANSFPIEVVKDKTCDQNYYGLVLIE
jgi:predicted metal-binding protein